MSTETTTDVSEKSVEWRPHLASESESVDLVPAADKKARQYTFRQGSLLESLRNDVKDAMAWMDGEDNGKQETKSVSILTEAGVGDLTDLSNIIADFAAMAHKEKVRYDAARVAADTCGDNIERANFLCHALSVETAAVNDNAVATELNTNLVQVVDWVGKAAGMHRAQDDAQLPGLSTHFGSDGAGERRRSLKITVGTAVADIETKLKILQQEEEEAKVLEEKRLQKEKEEKEGGGEGGDQVPLKDDPTYTKFFKMLSMHLPRGAVEQKMVAEGLDVAVLDMDPEKPLPSAEPAGPPLKDDPTYTKFFKMLSMHLPRGAVEQKMVAEGLDVAVLDMDPEKPAAVGKKGKGRADIKPKKAEPPLVKLKPLYWERVEMSPASQNLWVEWEGQEERAGVSKSEEEAIIKLFAQTVNKPGKAGGKNGKGGKDTEEKKVVETFFCGFDAKRAYGLGIILKTIVKQIDAKELHAGLRAADPKVVTEKILGLLEKFVPTEEEIANIANHQTKLDIYAVEPPTDPPAPGRPDQMDPLTRYAADAFLGVPDLAGSMECIRIRIEAGELVERIQSKLKILQVTGHMVTCHMPHATCHMPHATCHMVIHTSTVPPPNINRALVYQPPLITSHQPPLITIHRSSPAASHHSSPSTAHHPPHCSSPAPQIACDQITESETLRSTLQMILAVGNVMNGGTARGGAVGFKISGTSDVDTKKPFAVSDNKLARIKSDVELPGLTSRTMLHFVARVLRKHGVDLDLLNLELNQVMVMVMDTAVPTSSSRSPHQPPPTPANPHQHRQSHHPYNR